MLCGSVSVLSECLDTCADNSSAAVAAFTAARAGDARALVRLSRGFDHPGVLGTARFLVPLLLDIQLNKLAPALFTPPILRGMQDENNTFVGLMRRKRIERTAQLVLLASLATSIFPMAMAQAAYVVSGVGIGYGGAKFVRLLYASGGPRGALVQALAYAGKPLGWARSGLRSALLRMDPSLESGEGQPLGWKDLRDPVKKQLPGMPKPPKWMKPRGA
jgi:hypothetical protein